MQEKEEPKGFKKAELKAKKLLENKEQLKELLGSAQKKAKRKKEQMKSVWVDLQTLLCLLKAWKKGQYKEVPWRTILYAATAICYFVNPIDLIPDFIPITGFLDDITIITFVINSLKEDLNRFLAWEEKNESEE